MTLPPLNAHRSDGNSSSSSSARNNTLVAESDLQAALQSLREQDLSATSNDTLLLLRQECSVSLQRHLQRVVQPVSDEAFHVYVRDCIGVDDDDAGNDSDEEQTSMDMINDDYDFDEEDLLDVEYLQKVQALRQQVRERAQQVQTLQSSVVEQSVQLATRQVNLLVTDRPQTQSVDEDKIVAVFSNESLLSQMDDSLQTMTTALNAASTQVPSKLQSLQETLTVIQKQQQRKEMRSSTEQAIVRRDNDGSVASKATTSDAPPLAPKDRLANMLRD